MKIKILIFFLILNFILLENCNQDLLKSFYLNGLNEPTNIKLKICPGIENSCCTIYDQIQIYKNFKLYDQLNRVDDIFNSFDEIYFDLLSILNKIHFISETLKEKNIKNKKINSCFMISHKLKEIHNQNIFNYFYKQVQNVKNIFTKSYKGFYCALCDYKNHKYFDIKSKKYTVSLHFCRKFVQNTLSFLYYNNVFFPKYLNLINQFIFKCNSNGKFNNNSEVYDEFNFKLDDKQNQLLNECYEKRNKKNWFSFCKFLCEKFNIININQYFLGDKNLLKNYIMFLKKRIYKITMNWDDNIKITLSKLNLMKNERILENNISVSGKLKINDNKMYQIMLDEYNKYYKFNMYTFSNNQWKVFQYKDGSDYNLEYWNKNYDYEGIDLYYYGISTKLDYETYYNIMQDISNYELNIKYITDIFNSKTKYYWMEKIQDNFKDIPDYIQKIINKLLK